MTRRPRPDTRPDWRDPNMPVLMHRKSINALDSVPPATAAKVAQHRMQNDLVPTWRNDPTYNLRRKSK